jgi:hypothetical protein
VVMTFKSWAVIIFIMVLASSSNAQERTPGVSDLEQKLDQAARDMEALSRTIDSLRSELDSLKQASPAIAKSEQSAETSTKAPEEIADRIVGADLEQDEHDHAIAAMPEVFLQTRYSVAPISGSDGAFDPNFRVSRAEIRWAGKIADHLGGGLEIQYEPASDGSPEQILNDAFLEYYLNDHVTVRAGQFVKPFGFDVEQASSMREAPERSIFSGYFFPGERDRGLMLAGDFGFLSSSIFKDFQYFVGVFDGNRFFNDNNRQVNYMARVRKILDKKFAVGASMQLGKQILPPSLSGNDNERIFGVDFQFAVGRLGLRGETVVGNMPSTSVSLQPIFFPAFRPGAHSTAESLFIGYHVFGENNIYARYNQFNRDPMTGKNVRALDLGYFRPISHISRLSIDYQFKNHPSFEDDAVNARFQITWQIVFGKASGESIDDKNGSKETSARSKNNEVK